MQRIAAPNSVKVTLAAKNAPRFITNVDKDIIATCIVISANRESDRR